LVVLIPLQDLLNFRIAYSPPLGDIKGLLKRTAMHMRWHKEGIRENDRVMRLPSDGEAWKVLDGFDADFASNARNVHLGLATYDFDPFSTKCCRHLS
jgi:hypothetical protein